MEKPIQLLSGREASLALSVGQMRFCRAIKAGKVHADFRANGARGIDLFLPSSVKALYARKEKLFPAILKRR